MEDKYVIWKQKEIARVISILLSSVFTSSGTLCNTSMLLMVKTGRHSGWVSQGERDLIPEEAMRNIAFLKYNSKTTECSFMLF